MTIRPQLALTLISTFLLSFSTTSFADETPTGTESKKLTELTLLPTIHRNHLKSSFYNLKRLKSVMRDIKPEIVCSEITPPSLKAHDEGKKDRRLSVFPEYIDVILPLRKELKYKVIPCSAWSKEVNFQTVGVKKMTASHYENIAKALDNVKGEGKKVLITFGGGHIDGLLKHLRQRKDIKIIDYRPTLEKLRKEQAKAGS